MFHILVAEASLKQPSIHFVCHSGVVGVLASFPAAFWCKSKVASFICFLNTIIDAGLGPQLLFQYPVSQSQPAPFYVGGPMGGIDSMAVTEASQPQAPPPAPMTPAPPPTTSSCSAGPSPSSQGSETSFDCTHCGKSLRSRKNYSKHMFIHSGETLLTISLVGIRFLLISPADST